MKYLRLPFIGAAALLSIAATASASVNSRLLPNDAGQCPSGYMIVVNTIAVEVTLTPSSTVSTTTTPTTTSTTTTTTTTTEPVAPLSTVTVQSTKTKTLTLVDVSTSSSDAAAATTTTAAIAAVPAADNAASEQSTTTSERSPAAETTTASSSSSSSSSSTGDNTGEATYYSGDVSSGTCSFTGYTLPSGIFGAALSVDRWDAAAHCGECIVDQCPSCAANHIDLFSNAFSTLSELATGVIDITWSFTPCDVSGPLSLHSKDGSSAYWFAMQVVNANEAVTRLEVSTDNGDSWADTTRTYYNFFEKDGGFGTDTVDVRVTGELGEEGGC
ncbi:hypothetical protein N7510_003213 [Penicillium lagena]|uniref:uncharacterized protein n=1 Tax=Penicillium lagena TaxID=94218 RepID=UPI0025401D12|nr:uncharacterized protein N7510_003213 [Penicillium lagena]KAJ5619229.1 hypothetical protein N7510_003213 [Penicillium lagena]